MERLVWFDEVEGKHECDDLLFVCFVRIFHCAAPSDEYGIIYA